MTDRLSTIVTKSGDQGSTSLADGQRLCKSHPRIGAMGDIDELNSHIGLLITALQGMKQREVPTHLRLLSSIQHALFDLGSELAVPGFNALSPTIVTTLESSLTPCCSNYHRCESLYCLAAATKQHKHIFAAASVVVLNAP